MDIACEMVSALLAGHIGDPEFEEFAQGVLDDDDDENSAEIDAALAEFAAEFINSAPPDVSESSDFARLFEEATGQKYQPPPTKKRAKQKAPTQAELKANAEHEDAQSALREIYRRLTRALHPDRELDPREHARKTELMGKVNIAYEKKDLVTLLEVQLSLDQVDASSIGLLAAEKLQPLAAALKMQAP